MRLIQIALGDLNLFKNSVGDRSFFNIMIALNFYLRIRLLLRFNVKLRLIITLLRVLLVPSMMKFIIMVSGLVFSQVSFHIPALSSPSVIDALAPLGPIVLGVVVGRPIAKLFRTYFSLVESEPAKYSLVSFSVFTALSCSLTISEVAVFFQLNPELNGKFRLELDWQCKFLVSILLLIACSFWQKSVLPIWRVAVSVSAKLFLLDTTLG